ncbi:methyltransferase [Streptomyces sp. SID8359]|uniref:methyltransferase n=1 Tax=unclassified Streptomyces TaxID=2593676 RepID=UPI00048E5853|nr:MULTISPECIES: methyltransferase [unclassified Streptomyces]MYT93224.1 methyltransferase [Streptomyces sp. SID8359]
MNRLTTSQGTFELARFPEHPSDPFRAWDASDEYLLRQLTDAEAGPVDLSGTVAVVGDRWGALATALAAHRPVQISDSYLARRATLANLGRNGLDAGSVTLLSSRDTPPERIDVLLVRVPKSLALLEDQLHRVAPAVHAGTVIIGTGMVKEIHTSTLRLFERIIGPTRTSLAVRKARLIFTTPDPDPAPERTPNPWPYRYELPTGIGPASGRTVVNHAGIFCADRLDIGTRFFLKHLPTRSGPVRIADLGCGNGVLGLSAALANPDAHLTFVDESYGAVASAEETFRLGAPDGAKADFLVGDGLADLAPGSLDLVLNNPPFHSHLATTDATARTMFAGARTALRQGGELWVVGNRHLSYHTHLRRIFGNCTAVAGDPKFVVLRAVKR